MADGATNPAAWPLSYAGSVERTKPLNLLLVRARSPTGAAGGMAAGQIGGGGNREPRLVPVNPPPPEGPSLCGRPQLEHMRPTDSEPAIKTEPVVAS